jgi:hypothetical protein
MLQEKVTQETQWLKLESTEHVRKGVLKLEHMNIDIHRKIVMRTCSDSLASPERFTKLECHPVSSYPITIESSMGCKI